MNKLRITKVYFPTVTVIKVDDGVQSRYYTSTQPGEMYPSIDVIETESKWQEVLAEAKTKGARVESEEFLLRGEEPDGRPFPKTYGDWVDLGVSIKEKAGIDDFKTIADVNERLYHIWREDIDPETAQVSKRWLTRKARELGIE